MPATHGGQVHEWARMHSRDVNEVLDFSANIHPFGPPDGVWQAIHTALPQIRHYPDASHRRVREVLGRRLSVDPERIVCGNGAVEAMECVLRVWRPRRVVVLEPAFAEYAAIARRLGILVVSVTMWTEPTYRHGPSLRAAAAAPIRPGDVVCFNHPHNPSGVAWPRSAWEGLVRAWLDAGAFVLVDESFMDFLADEAEYTALALGEHPRLAVVRSATKIFAIPGLRFGYAVVSPDVARRVAEERDPWSVNTLAQAAAAAAYLEDEFLRETRHWLAQERARLDAAWREALPAWDRLPGQVNFYTVRLPSQAMARAMARRLAEQGILVRLCGSFTGLSDAVWRLAIRSPEENDRLLDALRRLAVE